MSVKSYERSIREFFLDDSVDTPRGKADLEIALQHQLGISQLHIDKIANRVFVYLMPEPAVMMTEQELLTDSGVDEFVRRIREAAEPSTESESPRNLHADLAQLLNKYSTENGSDTPDYILARYLLDVLHAFDYAVKDREQWYGRGPAAVPPHGVCMPCEERGTGGCPDCMPPTPE